MKKFAKSLFILTLALVSVFALIACDGKKEEKTYTYRMGPSDLPTAWNVHTYQSNSSTYVLDYSSDSLYTFDYNADKTGFTIVPSMASDYPTEVTADYVGQYGVTQEDVGKGKVWSIPLKTNLKYDNGDPITATNFVESMKLLLNPKAANFRADNVYQSGDLKIVGAADYVKGGTFGTFEFVSANYGEDEYVDPAEFGHDAEGYVTVTINGVTSIICVDVNSGGNWGSNGLEAYGSRGYLGNPRTTNADGTRYKYCDANGGNVVWRNVEEEEDGSFKWFDAPEAGNEVTEHITEDDSSYYYDETAIAWKNCPGGLYGALLEAADEKGLIKCKDADIKNVQDAVAMLHGYADVEEYAADGGDYAYQEFEEMALLGRICPEIAYEGNVGFFEKDGKLIVVLVNPMEDNFFLRYELCTSFFLVHDKLYKECESNEQGVYANKYGTSVDTYIGFGPYKLTNYTADNQMTLERNEFWHGYSKEEWKEGTYQTDKVQYIKVNNDKTRLEMFLKGELDSYGLRAEDMETYLGSKYTYFNDSESTWYLAMNPQYATLEKNQTNAHPETEGKEDWPVVKTVLAIQDFRKALSYSINREQFNLALSPTSGVAVALLSSMIYADPDNGVSYRSMDCAKDAILNFWGLADQWGEGKKYATRDEAIASITGYDPSGAKQLFTNAYNTAVAEGYITEAQISSGKWMVQIVIGNPVTANFYTKGFEFLSTCWAEAVVGTPFEGHLECTFSQELGSTSFGSYLRNGSVDVLFGVGYGGSMFNPYSMMDCFTGSLQYDPFTDKNAISLDVKIGEKTYRTSLYNWVSQILLGTETMVNEVKADGSLGEQVALAYGASADATTRAEILAQCETKILTLSNIFPLQTDASASLRCMRVQYYTEEYVLGMGRGGLQYNTYTMSDQEFAAYVAKQPGKVLDYSVSE